MPTSTLKCTNCKDRFKRETMRRYPVGYFCSDYCASQYAISKRRALQTKKIRKDTDERKKALKTLTEWKSDAQKVFNQYIRLRDSGMECPSCGKLEAEVLQEQGWKVGGAFDAGHFMSRGAKSQLRFNTLNVWRQCKSCNAGSGKFSHKAATVSQQYEDWLRVRIGDERVEALKNDNSIGRINAEYCQRIIKVFRKKIRLYKKLFR